MAEIGNADTALSADWLLGLQDVGDGSQRNLVRMAMVNMANLLAPYATMITFATKADALAVAGLQYPENTGAYVWSDATVANRGVYRKAGAVGSGTWVRVADLPASELAWLQTATVTGAGLVTGGGPLSGSPILTVKKATPAAIAAGTEDDSSITPAGLQGRLASVFDAFGGGDDTDGVSVTTAPGEVLQRQHSRGDFITRFLRLFAGGTGFRVAFADGTSALAIKVASRFRMALGPYQARSDGNLVVPVIKNLHRTLPLVPDTIATRLGAFPLSTSTSRPFIVVWNGQSNAFGSSNGGDTSVDQRGAGIWVYSSLNGGVGGTMVPADFATLPLSTTKGPQNAGVHFCNELRRMQVIPDDRPMWLVITAQGGTGIEEHVNDTGTDGVRFRLTKYALDACQSIWEAAGGRGTLRVDHMHWQQGEQNGDEVTSSVVTSDAAYIDRWDKLMALWKAMPYWTPETSVTVGECGRWGGMAPTSGNPAIVLPSNSRNSALRAIADGRRDANVGLVSSDGLVRNGLDDGDNNHFSGPGLVQIGIRAAHAFRALRTGTYVNLHRNDRAQFAASPKIIVVSAGTTRMLGEGDVCGGAVVEMDACTVWLPRIGVDYAPVLYLDVLTQSVIRAPSSGHVITGLRSVAPAFTLAPGMYTLTRRTAGWKITESRFPAAAVAADDLLGAVAPSCKMSFAEDEYTFSGVETHVERLLTRSGVSKWVQAEGGELAEIPAGRLAFDWASGRRRLIFEGASTNLFLQSQDVTAPPWELFGMTAATSVVVGPHLVGSAPILTSGAASWNGIKQTLSVTADTTYTMSIWVKLGTLAPADFKMAVYDATHGTWIVQSVAPATVPTSTGWTRCSVTFTTPAGCTSIIASPFRNAQAVSGTLMLWGAQLEVGRIASSLIVTWSSAATRAADIGDWSSAAATLISTTSPFTVALRMEIKAGLYGKSVIRLVGPSSTTTLLRTGSVGSLQAYTPFGIGGDNLTAAAFVPAVFGLCMGVDSTGRACSVTGGVVVTNASAPSGTVTGARFGDDAGVGAGERFEIDELIIWPTKGAGGAIQAQAHSYL